MIFLAAPGAMTAFWRLWAGPVCDYQVAFRIVVNAGVALPAMFPISFALIGAEDSLVLGRNPAPPAIAVWSLIFLVSALLGGWLVSRMSKSVSLVVLVLTVSIASLFDVFLALFARDWVPYLLSGPPDQDTKSAIIAEWSVALLAAGWSATAFLSWRAVMATFAVARLRLSAQSPVGEVFD